MANSRKMARRRSPKPLAEATINESNVIPMMSAPELPNIEELANSKVSFSTIGKIIRDLRTWIVFLENNYNIFREEFGLTDAQMEALVKYNTAVAEPPPETPVLENVKDEDGNDVLDDEGNPVTREIEHDLFNGLRNIPMDKVEEIFGKDHPIIGLDITQTRDRIRDVVESFHALWKAHADYREIEKAYLSAMEESEFESIEALKRRVDEEEDPEKKAKIQESIDRYYDNKYLNFIPELAAELKSGMLKAYSDPKRIQYMLKRSREYMQKMDIPEKFILQISSFEKRFLPEKYHKQNSLVVLLFMYMMVYHQRSSKESRQEVIAFVLAMDRFTRNIMSDEERENVMSNLLRFEDIFVDDISEMTNVLDDEEVQ